MQKAKRTKKAKTFMYGIEITKPWSKEMYAHNERTAEHLKEQIKTAFAKTYTCEPIQEDSLRDIATEIVGYQYGEGFSLQDIIRDTLKNLDDHMFGYQLHEAMHYLHHKGYVKTQSMGLIGYQPDPHLVPYWEVK
jgi:basic membrane lipoprotein Med (substrate-binding protein (PBP1-ABC) superfamily)